MKKEKVVEVEAEIEKPANFPQEELVPQELMPQMNVGMMAPVEEKKEVIASEKVIKVCEEVLDNIRQDRAEVDQMLAKFMDLMDQGGDASTSTKEGAVNLMKIKLDTADKMSKIAELWMRAVLKERDTFPRYLAAQQHNTYNIEKKEVLSERDKKSIIDEANQE